MLDTLASLVPLLQRDEAPTARRALLPESGCPVYFVVGPGLVEILRIWDGRRKRGPRF